MSLENTINSQIKEAMKAKEREKLEALRAIKTAILLAKSEKGKDATLTEEEEIKILNRLKKQRQDAYEVFTSQSRADLAEVEQQQLQIIETFLPKQLSEEELSAAIKSIIEKVGATSPQEMGKVMGVASKELAGKADGKVMSQMVRTLLAQ